MQEVGGGVEGWDERVTGGAPLVMVDRTRSMKIRDKDTGSGQSRVWCEVHIHKTYHGKLKGFVDAVENERCVLDVLRGRYVEVYACRGVSSGQADGGSRCQQP